MGVVPARLAFLAFLGLGGGIMYNALYLQDGHGGPSTAGGSTLVNDGAPVTVPLPTPSPQSATSEVAKAEPAAQGHGNDLVRDIQAELKARGYQPGEADGRMRDDTKAAISAYERSEGLPITGKASDEILARLLLAQPAKTSASTGSVASAPTTTQAVKPASGDNTVKRVQEVLADLGYDPGVADGEMGATTKSAIAAFQRDRKITQDGRITPVLLKEIKRVTGKSVE
jgi:peptidoglycan hydrolase-like protein with peptidoglycan-binding domain